MLVAGYELKGRAFELVGYGPICDLEGGVCSGILPRSRYIKKRERYELRIYLEEAQKGLREWRLQADYEDKAFSPFRCFCFL
jgi:hypothetical protein